jgi:hypothetical protein
MNNNCIPKWKAEGEDEATFLRAIRAGHLTTVFAEKHEAEEIAATKKGLRNQQLNFLKLWMKYKKWLRTIQGESLLLLLSLLLHSCCPFNTHSLVTLMYLQDF